MTAPGWVPTGALQAGGLGFAAVTMLPYCNEGKFEAVVEIIRIDIFMPIRYFSINVGDFHQNIRDFDQNVRDFYQNI